MAAVEIDHGSKAMDMNNHEMIRDRGMIFEHLSYLLSELMNNSKVVSELASLVVRWSAIMMLDKDRKFLCSEVSRCRVLSVDAPWSKLQKPQKGNHEQH